MSNYTVATFLAQPIAGEHRLKIFDKDKRLKYTIDHNVAYFFTKGTGCYY